VSSSDREHVQTVRNAWINHVRDEALRMHRPEVSKAAHIGMLIATYADADGSNAFPAGKTLAAIAGCTEETVTRCVKLLVAVGLLDRKRRPNKSAMYQLRIPLQRPHWEAHLHLYTDTRQARRKREAKQREVLDLIKEKHPELLRDDPRNPFYDGDRNPLQNGDQEARNPFPVGVPETVPAGGSETSGTRSRTGTATVPERVPETVPAGGDQYQPPYGRDPHTDHDADQYPTQPPVRAGAREAKNDHPLPPATTETGSPPSAPDGHAFTRCAVCQERMVPRPGRTTHAHCASAKPEPNARDSPTPAA
jgi:hypothetical protein